MSHHKQWVSEIFDRAASGYGKKSGSFFSYFGKRLTEQVDISPNQRILDVATGRGAVLFPLAEAVGPLGTVIGIDISREMINETSNEVLKRNIPWVQLHQMDAECLDFPDNHFDFVFCGFALFFLPSIAKGLSEFKRVLKPGGILAVSIWGEDSELDALINEEVKKLRHTNSLAATTEWNEKKLRTVLEEAAFTTIQITEETKVFSHNTAEEWWDSLWNHAIRAKLEQLSVYEISEVREKALRKANNLDKGSGIPEHLQVLYGTAKKEL